MQDQEPSQQNNGLDDFMDSIGLDVKPMSPEHAFIITQTGGTGYRKIHNFRYWIRHEIFGWFDLVENNATPCKKVLDTNKGEMVYVPLTREEYVLIKTKYYLRMNNLPWFNSDISGLGVANLDKTARMMIDTEEIKPLLAAKKSEMPRNI